MSISFVHVMVVEGLFDSLRSSGVDVGFISIPSFVSVDSNNPFINAILNIDSYLSSPSVNDENPSGDARSIFQQFTSHEITQLYWQFRRRHSVAMQLCELEIYLLKVIQRCLNLLRFTKTSLIIFGGIPHSFYDYVLLLASRQNSIPLRIFQEFPWTPYGCIEYSERLIPIPQPLDHFAYSLPLLDLTYGDLADKLAHNIMCTGKAFVPELLVEHNEIDSKAQYWLKSYIKQAEQPESYPECILKPPVATFLHIPNATNISFLRSFSHQTTVTDHSTQSSSLYRHLLHMEQFQMTIREIVRNDCNDIYILPLPCEPECSINPMCNEFVTTSELVDHCMSLFPKAIILLREHPGMLGLQGLRENPHLDPIISYRYPLHELLVKTPRLRWLPIDISVKYAEIIENIPIIYAVGTIGVETYIKGKAIVPVATSILNLAGYFPAQKIFDSTTIFLDSWESRSSTPTARCKEIYRHVLPFSPVGRYNGFFHYSAGSDFISAQRLLSYCLTSGI